MLIIYVGIQYILCTGLLHGKGLGVLQGQNSNDRTAETKTSIGTHFEYNSVEPHV